MANKTKIMRAPLKFKDMIEMERQILAQEMKRKVTKVRVMNIMAENLNADPKIRDKLFKVRDRRNKR